MKKKLKLDDLKVKSFVTTELSTQNVKGGGPLPETMGSCYAYVTCNVIGCVATQYGNHCYTGGATNTIQLEA